MVEELLSILGAAILSTAVPAPATSVETPTVTPSVIQSDSGWPSWIDEVQWALQTGQNTYYMSPAFSKPKSSSRISTGEALMLPTPPALSPVPNTGYWPKWIGEPNWIAR